MLYLQVANNLSVDPWVHELLPEANEVTVKRERIVNGLGIARVKEHPRNCIF